MARKTTTKSTTGRSKTAFPVQPPAAQAAAETSTNVPKNGGNGGTAGFAPGNFEEEIRRRAYELYQRRATAGAANGDENQDWLVAEQEILSLHGGHGQHSA
jgi:hypothetical protein